MRRRVGQLVLALIGVVLLGVAAELPPFGERAVPAWNEVSRHYLHRSLSETGAANAVAGIITDYRGFDTLGEVTVLFAAVTALLAVLAHRSAVEQRGGLNNPILQTAARVLVPLVQLFGLAIIAYGHLSPGGGFSGGAVLAAGFILYAFAFGLGTLAHRLPDKTARTAESLGTAWFAVLGLAGLATGSNYLANALPPGSPGRLLSGGLIALITAGVGLKVAATMVTLFRHLVGGEGGEEP